MDCDGLKKVVVQDLDGTLLGTANATAISQAEFEWDGDPARGVGDYRIPVGLRQRVDGTEIPAEEKFPNKGIVRDSSCSFVTSWRAWRCSGLRHRMLVLESLDADSLVRRLSPVALIANPGPDGYVDLVNGPMDHGWCLGYTCQRRISTFYSVVAPGQVYEVAMTSLPPQELRLRLLHSDPSEVVLLRLFYPMTQRLDVYVDGAFVPPTNVDPDTYPESYQLFPEDPDDPESFYPTLQDTAGSNYLARESKFLHVVVRGGNHSYDIRTSPVVVLSLGILVTEDDFYEAGEVVRNVALLLNVAPENVRVTDIVREDSRSEEREGREGREGKRRRKRKASAVVNIEVEVSGAPLSSLQEAGHAIGGDALSYDDLLNRLGIAVDCFQSLGCGANIVSLKVKYPVAPPDVPELRSQNEQFGALLAPGAPLYSDRQLHLEKEELDQLLQGEVFLRPSYVEVMQEPPKVVTTNEVFRVVVAAFTENGTKVTSLGSKGYPWMLTASLEGGPPEARLQGSTTVPYSQGQAVFSDLVVDTPGGDYRLKFRVTSPENAPTLEVTLEDTFSVELDL
ncbi:fibrocystin-L-like [Penaeus chinensis]|uniref:fibrocystin-L-like n=1 Tax=Penaeus chinensis TaxID=139456 RepID=UPI001FB6EEF8|nr:fibrocystin-L-like [Penaeus chinensis]